MIHYKTPEQIELMVTGGKILSEVLYEVVGHAKPGVSELELDILAETRIREKGGEPGFKKVPGYNYTVCVSTNDVVVHGIPTKYRLKEGDVIGIDCGVFYKGFHTDMSETRRVSIQNSKFPLRPSSSEASKIQNSDEIDKFLETGKRALREAINVAKKGNRIGHISQTIQRIVEKEGGYSVVRSLIGHGVGKELHEDPEVPGYAALPLARTPELKPGMTIAVEVIYNMGKPDVVYGNRDGWTIKTKDGSISGVFERTIAITEKETLMVTP